MTGIGKKSLAEEKQLDKLHCNFKACCQNHNSFHSSFEINTGHIIERTSQSAIRFALLRPERMAGVIALGTLNYERCTTTLYMVLAIEGKFLEFEWVDIYSTTPLAIRLEKDLCVRVIVREC